MTSIQVQYYANREIERHNREMEGLEDRKIRETNRANVAREMQNDRSLQLSYMTLGETMTHNRRTETLTEEQNRINLLRQRSDAELNSVRRLSILDENTRYNELHDYNIIQAGVNADYAERNARAALWKMGVDTALKGADVGIKAYSAGKAGSKAVSGGAYQEAPSTFSSYSRYQKGKEIILNPDQYTITTIE